MLAGLHGASTLETTLLNVSFSSIESSLNLGFDVELECSLQEFFGLSARVFAELLAEGLLDCFFFLFQQVGSSLALLHGVLLLGAHACELFLEQVGLTLSCLHVLGVLRVVQVGPAS